MTRQPSRPLPRAISRRSADPTLDEFVGEWWDRHAEATYTHRDLVAAVPLLVRYVLPHLGQTRVRTLSADDLSRYVDQVTANDAGTAIVDASLDLLDDVLTCAADWGVVSRNPLDDPETTVWPRRQGADIVPFPGRRSPGVDLPDSA